jgi:hypothetical protein
MFIDAPASAPAATTLHDSCRCGRGVSSIEQGVRARAAAHPGGSLARENASRASHKQCAKLAKARGARRGEIIGLSNKQPLCAVTIISPSRDCSRAATFPHSASTSHPATILLTTTLLTTKTTMNTSVKIVLLLALFAMNIAVASAQKTISLPPPVFSQRDAGRYAPKIEEIRLCLLKNKHIDAVRLIHELKKETEEAEKKRESAKTNSSDSSHKEDIAAKEWINFFVAKTRYSEIFEMKESEQNDKILSALTGYAINRVTIISEKDVEKFSLNKKNIIEIRFQWATAIIKKDRENLNRLEEGLCACAARFWEEQLSIRIREKGKRINRGYKRFPYEMSYYASLDYACLFRKEALGTYEAILVLFLFEHYENNFQKISRHIKNVGYESAAEQAYFIRNVCSTFNKCEWNVPQFYNYIAKEHRGLKSIIKLADEYEVQLEEKKKKMENKWKKIAKEKQKEYMKYLESIPENIERDKSYPSTFTN